MKTWQALRIEYKKARRLFTNAFLRRQIWLAGRHLLVKTATQSGLAANARQRQFNCQNLMPPAPWFFFFKIRLAWRPFLWRSVPLLCSVCQGMWHICHNSERAAQPRRSLPKPKPKPKPKYLSTPPRFGLGAGKLDRSRGDPYLYTYVGNA